MAQDPAIPTMLSPAMRPLTGAQRMRRHRQRRRRGLRCTTAVLNEAQIEGLVRRGWLARERREDGAAIRTALHHYLDDNL
jgi:hypothetical protein